MQQGPGRIEQMGEPIPDRKSVTEDMGLDKAIGPSVGPSRSLRIAVVTLGDARSVSFWSGTPFSMSRALINLGHDVVFVGPLKAKFTTFFKIYARLAEMIGFQPRRYLQRPLITRQLAEQATEGIDAAKPDIILAIAGSTFIGQVPRGLPLVYTSDATIRALSDYYPKYQQMPVSAKQFADALEQDCIGRADAVLYPSSWAANSAIRDYGADPVKTHVIPWGANDEDPISESSSAIFDPPTPGRAFRLLLVGVDWQRKGADIAVQTLRNLRARGMEVELTICGCTPPEPMSESGITIIPFLDKRDPSEKARLAQLYKDADLFILPTKADCYGIVFCEAASYGLPSIAPATGGVPDAVRENQNGILVPEGATAEVYADAIAHLVGDPERLAELSRSSRLRYETELNWEAWARSVTSVMQSLLR